MRYVNLYSYIISSFFLYCLLRFLCPEQIINLWTSIALIILFFVCLCGGVLCKKLYKYSSLLADRRYLVGKHELKNELCSVDYSVGEKLTVRELTNYNTTKAKRFFIIKAKDGDIDKCWSDICRFFDISVSLDVLAVYIYKYMEIDVNVCEVKLSQNNKQNNQAPKSSATVEVNRAAHNVEAAPSIDMKKLSKIVQDGKMNKEKKSMTNYEKYRYELENQQFYNLSDIQGDKTNMPNTPSENSDDVKFVDIANAQSQAANNYNKINVNTASSEDIATLPGINIIIAKKIVRFRDLNGDFNSIDDFIKIAQVKEHFIPTLQKMVALHEDNIPQKSKDDTDGNNDDSRIIDF